MFSTGAGAALFLKLCVWPLFYFHRFLILEKALVRIHWAADVDVDVDVKPPRSPSLCVCVWTGGRSSDDSHMDWDPLWGDFSWFNRVWLFGGHYRYCTWNVTSSRPPGDFAFEQALFVQLRWSRVWVSVAWRWYRSREVGTLPRLSDNNLSTNRNKEFLQRKRHGLPL